MQQQTSEALRAWFRRVEPIYPELFNAAHAMCGNYDLAEYALRSAILEVWLQNAGSGMGFRERLRAAVRREAFSAALSPESAGADFTWPGIAARGDDPILQQAAQERPETQRVLMLRYGCGLSLRGVAQLTGVQPGQARAAAERFEARCRRSLPRQERSRADAQISRSLRRALARTLTGIPGPAQVYRAFESEAAGMEVSGHRFSRGFGRVMAALLALLCAALFWLIAVIAQPAVIEQAPDAGAAIEAPAAADRE